MQSVNYCRTALKVALTSLLLFGVTISNTPTKKSLLLLSGNTTFLQEDLQNSFNKYWTTVIRKLFNLAASRKFKNKHKKRNMISIWPDKRLHGEQKIESLKSLLHVTQNWMTAFTGEYKLRLPYTLLAVSSRIFSLSENQETVTCHVYRDKVNYVSISTHVCAQCQKNLPLKMIHNKM